MPGRLAGALLMLLVGGVTGVASVAVHQKSVPWLVLALAAPLAAELALSPGWWRVGFGAGWVAVVLLAAQGRPEGDYVIAATVSGYLLLAGALVLIVLSLATLPVRRAKSDSGGRAT